MDAVERESRRQRAASLLPGLAEAGVTAVATTFVDNSGITRVKTVPLDRFPHLAAWGVGASTSFDYFRFDDWLAAPPDGRAPVGDVRILPDVGRVVPLAAQPGWAWTPGERYDQDGAPHPQCSRLLLRRQSDALAAEGFSVKAAFEIEWVLSAGDGDAFVPAASGPGYGMSRLISVSDYARDLLDALGPRRTSRSCSSIPSTRADNSSCPSRPAGRSRPPTRPCWFAAPSAPSGSSTACGRRSPPRSRSTGSGTAATCTSVFGAMCRAGGRI